MVLARITSDSISYTFWFHLLFRLQKRWKRFVLINAYIPFNQIHITYITIEYHICHICNRKLYVSFWYSDSVWCKKWRKNRCHNFQWVKGKGKGLGLLMEMIILVEWNIKCAFKHIWVNSVEIWSLQAHLNQIHTFLKQKDLRIPFFSLKKCWKSA